MKVEGVDAPAILDPSTPGNRAKSESITHVLLSSGWMEVEPKSFRMMAVQTKDNRQIPFVRFDTKVFGSDENVRVVTVELTSPTDLHAVAYPAQERDA